MPLRTVASPPASPRRTVMRCRLRSAASPRDLAPPWLRWPRRPPRLLRRLECPRSRTWHLRPSLCRCPRRLGRRPNIGAPSRLPLGHSGSALCPTGPRAHPQVHRHARASAGATRGPRPMPNSGTPRPMRPPPSPRQASLPRGYRGPRRHHIRRRPRPRYIRRCHYDCTACLHRRSARQIRGRPRSPPPLLGRPPIARATRPTRRPRWPRRPPRPLHRPTRPRSLGRTWNLRLPACHCPHRRGRCRPVAHTPGHPAFGPRSRPHGSPWATRAPAPSAPCSTRPCASSAHLRAHHRLARRGRARHAVSSPALLPTRSPSQLVPSACVHPGHSAAPTRVSQRPTPAGRDSGRRPPSTASASPPRALPNKTAPTSPS